jgi:transposase
MPESPVPPSYGELAALVAAQAGQLTEQATLIEAMRVELAALRRQAGRDSSNSSQPPSQDGPGAEAKARAEKRAGRQSIGDGPGSGEDSSTGQGGTAAKKRTQGGQRGHRGSGLARVADPQHTKPVEPPACGNCGADLAGAPGDVGYSVQVFDLPTFSLEVTDYLMMRRVCGCGHPTTAQAPSQVRGGPACYGPQVAAASAWLASQDVIGIERAADMMAALLGAPVSTGYVSSCVARLDTALTTAGFEDELKAALREQDVLGTDETPAPLTATGAAAEKTEDCSNPQVFTVRTMRAYTRGWAGDPGQDQAGDLVWYGAAGTRTKKAITAFGILETFAGVLVRDDFGGYLSYDKKLAGVQQCLSHLLRYLDDAYDIDPATQMWARQVADALRTTIHAFNTARRNGTAVDLDTIARARCSYGQGVAVGISINLSRPWHKGKHPGLILAKRLQRKAKQVWLFTTRPHDVPPTNNGSEAAIRGFKLAEKVQGCWRSLTTLRRHCRIRSYTISARNHGRRPIDAIRDAFTGTPWMPPRLTTTAPALAA